MSRSSGWLLLLLLIADAKSCADSSLAVVSGVALLLMLGKDRRLTRQRPSWVWRRARVTCAPAEPRERASCCTSSVGRWLTTSTCLPAKEA